MSGTPEDQGLLTDDAIKQRVEAIWSKVFNDSNRVLQQAKEYGFSGISVFPSPNIHQMLVTLQIFSAVIDILVTYNNNKDNYDETRLLLNAKAQITRMEQLAAALRANDEPGYNVAVEALEKQAVF